MIEKLSISTQKKQEGSLLEQSWFTQLMAGVLMAQVIALGFSLKYRDQIIEYARTLPALVQNTILTEDINNSRPRPFE